MQAMKGANAVGPFLGERQSVATDHLKARPPRVVGTDLEARRKDQTVELVGHPVDDDPALGDALNPAATRIDQRHVVAIERLQIFVVETGPLAVVAVPGLQRLGGGWVGHNRVDARPDFLHFGEVREFGLGTRGCQVAVSCRITGSFLVMLVHASLTRSSSASPPLVSNWKFSMRSRCQPALRPAAHCGSVGRFARTSTEDGVR